MGIRIRKSIGFWLTQDKMSDFFNPDAQDIIENFSESETEDFIIKIKSEAKKFFSEDKTELMLLDMALEELKSKKTGLYKLISQPFENDDGVLLSNVEQAQSSRYDDTIDYYEGPSENDIKFLNRPIFPDSGYIYTGGLEEIFQNLKEGDIIIDSLTRYAFIINKQIFADGFDITNNREDFVRVMRPYFHPKIDSFIYLLAKASGLLKDGISEREFNLALEPVIITSWS